MYSRLLGQHESEGSRSQTISIIESRCTPGRTQYHKVDRHGLSCSEVTAFLELWLQYIERIHLNLWSIKNMKCPYFHPTPPFPIVDYIQKSSPLGIRKCRASRRQSAALQKLGKIPQRTGRAEEGEVPESTSTPRQRTRTACCE